MLNRILNNFISRERDEKLYDELYREYFPIVRKYVFNLVPDENEIEDVVHDTFIKVWKNIDKFQQRSSIKTWIYRIATNTAIDHLKNKKKHSDQVSDEFDLENVVSGSSFSDNVDSRDLIQKALLELKEESRVIVTLFFFEDLLIEEIAELLGLAEGTVKSRLFYAKKKIKEYMDANGVHYE